MHLEGKNVLVGVTASIAAYKVATLTRLLIKAGANVKVVMSPASLDFITPLTLATLSKNQVFSDFTEDEDKGTWNNHVDLGLWADLMVVAPATANSMGKMVSGQADNFLLATYLSAKCKVMLAPAMDLDMYKHPSTKANLEKLESFGNVIIPAGSGELASGLVGEGRMAEPEEIIDFVIDFFNPELPFKGKKIIISAGPTYERIDPVRFIGNHSSGKMGYRIAEQAKLLGAEVVLVSGPSHQKLSVNKIKKKDVFTAAEMFEAVKEEFNDADACIMAAAVADYTPITVADNKIKKAGDNLIIECKRTQDILKYLGENKKTQKLVGFALETQDEVENAKKKIKKKNLDFIVLNSLRTKGAGFKGDTNKVSIIDKDNNMEEFELKSKEEVAKDILNKLAEILD